MGILPKHFRVSETTFQRLESNQVAEAHRQGRKHREIDQHDVRKNANKFFFIGKD